MDVLDRVRALSASDLAHTPPADLRTWHAELTAIVRSTGDTVDRILRAAETSGHVRLTNAQQRDHDAALARNTDAAQLAENLAEQLVRSEVDRSLIVVHPSGPAAGPDYADGRPLERAQTMAGFARAVEPGQADADSLSLRRYLRGIVTGDWTDGDAERRAMSEGVMSGGGYMVPTILAAELVDLARARTRVLEAGARLVPMANKTVDVAKWAGDPAAAWHTEAAVISPSDATIGKVTLTAKALASLTVVSRELLEDAQGIETQLRNAIAAQFALTVDRAALYGSGTDPEPRGVANTTGVTTLSMGTNGATPTSYDWHIDAVGTLADRNETATGTIISPRTARTIGKLKATDGQPLNVPAYVANVPLLDTAQVPNDRTQGTATNASDAFTADWSQLMVGLRTALSLQVLTERYADTGQIGLLTWWRGDIAVARASAFVRTTGLLP